MAFRDVTPSNPCPICGKPDWCSVTEDGERAVCHRRPDHPRYGTGKEKENQGGQVEYHYALVERPKDAPRTTTTRPG